MSVKTEDHLVDACNVMGMEKIIPGETGFIKCLGLDFIKDNVDIKALTELTRSDVFTIEKNGVVWARLSREYYDKAKRIANEWNSANVEFHVRTEKHGPVLMAFDDLGFVLAPRLESEE